MLGIDTCNHYWLREDGLTVFSSRRQIEVPTNDFLYKEWCAQGNTPHPYPKNLKGEEDRDALNAILRPYGLRVTPLTPEEEAVEREAEQAGVVTRYRARQLHEEEVRKEMKKW